MKKTKEEKDRFRKQMQALNRKTCWFKTEGCRRNANHTEYLESEDLRVRVCEFHRGKVAKMAREQSATCPNCGCVFGID